MTHALVISIVILVVAWFPAIGNMVKEIDGAGSLRNDSTMSSAFLAVMVAGAITVAGALCGWVLSQELRRPECLLQKVEK